MTARRNRCAIELCILLLLMDLAAGCSKASPLESWVGDYTFSEYAPPDQNAFYRLSILNDAGRYYATLSIDGFQRMGRLQATVSGNQTVIKILFAKYLPGNVFEAYSEGDLLLSIKKTNSQLYTAWGEVQPLLKSNKTDGVYFRLKPKQSLTGLQEQGLTIIDDQSFWVELGAWGKVRFVSGMTIGDNQIHHLRFYLVDGDGDVQYEFPDPVGTGWVLYRLQAVSFIDINKDGLKDIVTIADYMTGAGPEGAIPFHVSNLYFQRAKEFVNLPLLDEEINDAQANDSVDMIVKFLSGRDIKLP